MTDIQLPQTDSHHMMDETCILCDSDQGGDRRIDRPRPSQSPGLAAARALDEGAFPSVRGIARRLIFFGYTFYIVPSVGRACDSGSVWEEVSNMYVGTPNELGCDLSEDPEERKKER